MTDKHDDHSNTGNHTDPHLPPTPEQKRFRELDKRLALHLQALPLEREIVQNPIDAVKLRAQLAAIQAQIEALRPMK
jgi:hypothetical protein